MCTVPGLDIKLILASLLYIKVHNEAPVKYLLIYILLLIIKLDSMDFNHNARKADINTLQMFGLALLGWRPLSQRRQKSWCSKCQPQEPPFYFKYVFLVLFLHNRQGTSEFPVYAFQEGQYGFRRANMDSGGPIRNRLCILGRPIMG